MVSLKLDCCNGVAIESVAACKKPNGKESGRGGPGTGCRRSVCVTAPCRRQQREQWWDVCESMSGDRGGETARRRTENNAQWTVISVCKSVYQRRELSA